MAKYKNIYLCEILSKVKEGKQVFVLDRETLKIYNTLDLTVNGLANILNDTKENRYEAWIDESENEDEQ